MTEPKTRRPSGTGTVRRKGNSFVACWWVMDGGTGERAQRTKAFPTEKAAEKHLRGQLVRKDRGELVDVDRRLTVGELLDKWLTAKTVEGRRATTIAGYRIVIDKWIKPYLGAVKAHTLSTETVDEWLAGLLEHGARDGRPLSPRSTQLAGTVLRMALGWGVKRGHLARNVAADAAVPRPGQQQMTTWTAEQAGQYIAAAKKDREGTLYVLGLLRGMRRGELAGLRWDNVDLDGGQLHVLETVVIAGGENVTSGPKTARGKRRVPLDPYLVGMLREHRKTQIEDRLAAGSAWTDSGYVFTNELGLGLRPDHVSDRHEQLCAAAGLVRIRMHDLRHTAASLMLTAGQPVHVVAAILGHDPAICLRIYAHLVPGHTDAAGEALTRSIVGA